MPLMPFQFAQYKFNFFPSSVHSLLNDEREGAKKKKIIEFCKEKKKLTRDMSFHVVSTISLTLYLETGRERER